ncbi:hypothetical protein [Rhodococcus sp. 1R11]|nr:hypothetical protein [Rhodococcus sp. 1R11]
MPNGAGVVSQARVGEVDVVVVWGVVVGDVVVVGTGAAHCSVGDAVCC